MKCELEKGRISEELFFGMAKKLLGTGKLPEVVSIRRGSFVQERKHQTDFVMKVNNPRAGGEPCRIGIQIKSSKGGAYFFSKKYADADVYVLVMDKEMSIGCMLSALRDICDIETRRMYSRVITTH